jgi:hypothetical protein
MLNVKAASMGYGIRSYFGTRNKKGLDRNQAPYLKSNIL